MARASPCLRLQVPRVPDEKGEVTCQSCGYPVRLQIFVDEKPCCQVCFEMWAAAARHDWFRQIQMLWMIEQGEKQRMIKGD